MNFVRNIVGSLVVMQMTGLSSASAQESMMGSSIAGNIANNTSQGISNAIGAQKLAEGTSEMPQCQQQQCSCCADALMKILMGLMGLAQGAANGGAAGQHAGVGTLVQANENNTTADPVREASIAKVAQIAAATAKQLAKNGIILDTKSMKATLPNGTTMSASDIGSQSAMAAAGVSADSYKKIMGDVKALEKKLGGEAKAVAGGDVGGGKGASYHYKPPVEEQKEEAKKILPPPQVAGAVAQFKGNPIGTFSDNIFDLMARRYKEKVNSSQFLAPEAMPEVVNVPKRTLPPSAAETTERNE